MVIIGGVISLYDFGQKAPPPFRLLFSLFFALLAVVSVWAVIKHRSTDKKASAAPEPNEWFMAGANPQRTGWISEEVRGALRVEWYRPIEAYIDQKTQIITAGGRLYVATSKGLYVFRADNGDLVWQYNTELPLGHSPTVIDNVVYIGGFDKKLHALDSTTGIHLWEFSGAKSGFGTNPLVVDDKVIIGNRDGSLYAIGKHGAAQQGQQVWRFQTDGPITLSAAYYNGIVYVASNDGYAYGVRTSNGSQVWKSAKLPGDGFHSYYPVIYRDKVIFPATHTAIFWPKSLYYRFLNEKIWPALKPNGILHADFATTRDGNLQDEFVIHTCIPYPETDYTHSYRHNCGDRFCQLQHPGVRGASFYEEGEVDSWLEGLGAKKSTVNYWNGLWKSGTCSDLFTSAHGRKTETHN